MTRVLLSPFGHLDLLGVTQTAGIQKVSTICSDSGGSPCPVPAGRPAGTPQSSMSPQTATRLSSQRECLGGTDKNDP